MNLKLYNRLAEQLLGDRRFELGEPAIQRAIEAYRVGESGLAGAQRNFRKIQDWLEDYNTKFMRPANRYRLRYYQILALHFAETVLQWKRDGEIGYADRSMLAYWMATGSGKTLVMHLNILQYLEHVGDFDQLQIILTTPGVNLISQHRRELAPFVSALNRLHNNRIQLTIESTQALLQKSCVFFRICGSRRYTKRVDYNWARTVFPTSPCLRLWAIRLQIRTMRGKTMKLPMSEKCCVFLPP